MSNQDTLSAMGVRAKLNSEQTQVAQETAHPTSEALTAGPMIARKCASCDDEGVQRKPVAVSQPHDPDELEADRMADAFVGGQTIARMRGSGTEPDIRRKAQANGGAAGLPHSLSSLATSHGEPLSASSRRPFERFFQANLSDVRIHDNAAANRAARQLNAQAFARGSDVYFDAGKFDAKSADGQRLLAHELTHVVQPARDAGAVHRIPPPAGGPAPTDADRDADMLRRLQVLPEWNAIDSAPQMGGLEHWSERYPLSYEEMRTRAVAAYGQAGYDALFENDAEILVLVGEAERVISGLEDLRALYDTDDEAANAVIDYYVGIHYLWGAEDVRGVYEISYSYFGTQFAQNADFDLGLFQGLLERNVDDIVAEIESEADDAQADADADAEQREAWAGAAREWIGTVVAEREDIFFNDDLALETLLDPPEGSTDADEMVAVARFAGRMAAVLEIDGRYHAFTLSEDFSRTDVFVSPDWDSRTEIVRKGPYGDAVYRIVASGGFVTRTEGGDRFYGGDQARDPESYLEADTRLLESGRAAELGISPIAMFTSMVRNLALSNLRQAESTMTDIRGSMTTDHEIETWGGGRGLIRGPDPERGRELQQDTARLRELTLDAERLAQEVGEDTPLTDDQVDRRDALLNEMGTILDRNPAAGFFVQSSRDPDEDSPVEDDEVSDDLAGLREGDAAARAFEEAGRRRENIAIVRRAMFDDPDIVLGFEPLHAVVMAQFSSTDQLMIRGSMALKTLESVAATIGLVAVDVSLLIAGFFTGGSTWAGLTLHAAGTGLGMYHLNQQMQNYARYRR